MAGDPQQILRLDIANTLQSYIEQAEAHFVSGIGGLQQILAAVEEAASLRVDQAAPGGSTQEENP